MEHIHKIMDAFESAYPPASEGSYNPLEFTQSEVIAFFAPLLGDGYDVETYTMLLTERGYVCRMSAELEEIVWLVSAVVPLPN